MSPLNANEKLVDVARDSADGLLREEWSFRANGKVHCFARARRDALTDEWTYTLLTFTDFPEILGMMWKDPPRDVIDEARAQLTAAGSGS